MKSNKDLTSKGLPLSLLLTMRKPPGVTIIVVCSLAMSAYSQTGPKGIHFDSITLEEAERTIDAMEGQRSRNDFVAGAIGAHRMDILARCFNDQYALMSVLSETSKLPESPFRDEIVIMMLKSNSPIWHPDLPYRDGSRPFRGPPGEPFASALKRHLPTASLDSEILDSRAARLKLAADLEVAIAKESKPFERSGPSNSPSAEAPRNSPPKNRGNL